VSQPEPDNIADTPIGKVQVQALGRTNYDALYDFTLPDYVRAFLAIHQGNAHETSTIELAGLMPKLYGTYEGRPCRVVMVSTLGDVGISFEDKESNYAERVSIYDLTDYRDEMIPGAPSARAWRQWAIVDKAGGWIKITKMSGSPMTDQFRDPYTRSDVAVLYTERAKASREMRRVDPHGLLGFKVSTVRVHPEKD